MKEKILLVDDNTDFLVSLYKYIKKEIPIINIVGLACDGVEAEKYIEEFKPSIVLLDLNMPNLNGIELLKELKQNTTTVILVSGDIEMINEISLENFNNIENIFIKPFDFGKLKVDLEYVINCHGNNRIDNLINDKLSEFDFNTSSIGYKYLVNCIKEVFYYPNKLINIEKYVFPTIAKEFNISNFKNVKWSLQKLIDSMVRYTKKEIVLNNFPYTEKPTIKMFLTMMNQYLKEMYK